MGRPKALLPASATETFVGRLLTTLRAAGIRDPIVVGRADDQPLREEVHRRAAAYVVNPDADTGGQLSSLLTGLAALGGRGLRGVMMLPVDAPLVTPATIAALVTAFDETGAPIVRPRHQGRHGHPVIFSSAVFDDLRASNPAEGAKTVLRAHATRIVNVDVDDPGVLADLDTPEAYRAAFGRDPASPQS
jgi:molybdenum cofactor cytidylyltransferase